MANQDKTIKIGNRNLAPESLMMGYGYDPQLSEGSLKPPIFLTSTFVFETAADPKRVTSLVEDISLIYDLIDTLGLTLKTRA